VVRSSRSIAWAVYFAGCLIVALLVVYFVQTIPRSRLCNTYWASGWAASRGLNPYAAYPETFRSNLSPFGGPASTPDFNLNPPCLLPLFQALSHLSITNFVVAWTAGSFLLLIATVAMLLWHRPDMQRRQIVWLLLAAPALETLLTYEDYFLLFLLAAVAWISLQRKRELAAAIAIGLLVAIKPTFAFWPAFLFLRGSRRLALQATVVITLASIFPVLLYGPHIYRLWVNALANDPHWFAPVDIAITPYFRRLGLYPLGMVLAWALALFLAWRIWRTKPDNETATGIALCASVLCAPLAWFTYILPAAPGFVSRRWSTSSNVAAALLLIPSILPTSLLQGSRTSLALAGGIYFAAVWIILAGELARVRTSS
jgi:hypothetical protein